jgi:hypothetical protein
MGQLTFYFDVCFGKRFPEAISKARPPFSVEYHCSKKNRFRQDMPDDKWLSIIGQKGWVAFSHDRRFHTEEASIMAIKQHKVGCFYLPGAQKDTWTKLYMFVRAYDRLISVARETEKPFVFRLTALNKIEKVSLSP